MWRIISFYVISLICRDDYCYRAVTSHMSICQQERSNVKCFASSVTITFFWSLSSFSPILHISLRAALLRGALPSPCFCCPPREGTWSAMYLRAWLPCLSASPHCPEPVWPHVRGPRQKTGRKGPPSFPLAAPGTGFEERQSHICQRNFGRAGALRRRSQPLKQPSGPRSVFLLERGACSLPRRAVGRGLWLMCENRGAWLEAQQVAVLLLVSDTRWL